VVFFVLQDKMNNPVNNIIIKEYFFTLYFSATVDVKLFFWPGTIQFIQYRKIIVL